MPCLGAAGRIAYVDGLSGPRPGSSTTRGEFEPHLAKTQTVLGFAYLAQIDTGAARTAFTRAIELDQADPMPRLGMGLAKIREGDLEGGRIELEIAASLDPANSLIRSYLGKAYFEEKRYSLAGTQFDLAKALDPNDPTHGFMTRSGTDAKSAGGGIAGYSEIHRSE